MDDPTLELQRGVYQALGRCLIAVQQYEGLMKWLLIHHELAGSSDTLEARQAKRTEDFADQTLGMLAKALFKAYVTVKGDEQPLLDGRKVLSDQSAFGFRHNIVMSAEGHQQTEAAVAELVALRNEMVHKFLERFDLWSADGCHAASAYLADSYQRIDAHRTQLRDWALGLKQARATSAEWLQSDEAIDLIENGIAPDGKVHWPLAGIVDALRDAAKALSMQGWTRLDEAQAWISQHHPAQVPAKYGCRSWPQVLHESRQFDLRYQRLPEGEKIARFKERMASKV